MGASLRARGRAVVMLPGMSRLLGVLSLLVTVLVAAEPSGVLDPEFLIVSEGTPSATFHVSQIVSGRGSPPESLRVSAVSLLPELAEVDQVVYDPVSHRATVTLVFPAEARGVPSGSTTVLVLIEDYGDTQAGDILRTVLIFVLAVTAQNDPPTLVAGQQTVEVGGDAPIDGTVLVIADADDPPADELVCTLSTAPAHGELLRDGVVVSAGGTWTAADVAAGRLIYRHRIDDGDVDDAWACTLSDGIAPPTAPATVIVAVAPGDRPVLRIPPLAGSWTEGAPAAALAAGAEVLATTARDFNGGFISATILPTAHAGDVLRLVPTGQGAGQVSLNGIGVFYGGVAIGSVAGGRQGEPLTVTFFVAQTTADAVQALVRCLHFEHASDDPGDAVRTVGVVVNDGTYRSSAMALVRLAVVPVDDPPQVPVQTVSVPIGLRRRLNLVASDPDGPEPAWSLLAQPVTATATLLDPASGLAEILGTAAGRSQLRVRVASGAHAVLADIAVVVTGEDDARPHPRTDPLTEVLPGEVVTRRVGFTVDALSKAGALLFTPVGDAPAGLDLTPVDATTVEVRWLVPSDQPAGVHPAFGVMASDPVSGSCGVWPVLPVVRPVPAGGG
jgi:hypothetical protein